MKDWQLFEQECCTYLNSVLKDYPFTFKCSGGSNSNASDIEVMKNNKSVFSIEVKLSPAQSGQFVVLEDNNVFSYSPRNVFSHNTYSRQIVDHLNNKINLYTGVQQSAIDIDCPKYILTGWVKEHYRNKNSKFIITANSRSANKAIIPIEQLGTYFDVSACLRRKKSGSRNLPKSEYALAQKLLEDHFRKMGCKIKSFKREGSKYIVTLHSGAIINRYDRYLGNGLYISEHMSNSFVVRKLSKTNNANVIFSLKYKEGCDPETGLKSLISELKRFM